MEKNHCNQCANYRQHYILDESRIFQIHCGHRTQQIGKKKRPDAIACDKFEPAAPKEDAFVSKNYLSKALLKHLLSLELLPEIEDAPRAKKSKKL